MAGEADQSGDKRGERDDSCASGVETRRVFIKHVAGTSAALTVGPTLLNLFGLAAAEYTQRTLAINPTAGNAQAANEVLQTATPWPRYSSNTNIPGNGARMVGAVQHFESGAAPAPPGGSPPFGPPLPPPVNGTSTVFGSSGGGAGGGGGF